MLVWKRSLKELPSISVNHWVWDTQVAVLPTGFDSSSAQIGLAVQTGLTVVMRLQ